MEEQTITPIPNTKPPNDKLFKILLLVIGLLIVIGLFLNAYLLLRKEKPPEVAFPPTPVPTQIPLSSTPTPDQTTNWKTYISRNGKYFIKYPHDWTLLGDEFFKEDISMGMISVTTLRSPNFQLNKFNNRISINVSRGNLQEGKKVLEVWAKNKDGKLENITLDGIVGYKLTWQYSDPTSSASRVDLRFEKDGLLYDIELSVDNKTPNKDSDLEVGNLILSTFKFLP